MTNSVQSGSRNVFPTSLLATNLGAADDNPTSNGALETPLVAFQDELKSLCSDAGAQPGKAPRPLERKRGRDKDETNQLASVPVATVNPKQVVLPLTLGMPALQTSLTSDETPAEISQDGSSLAQSSEDVASDVLDLQMTPDPKTADMEPAELAFAARLSSSAFGDTIVDQTESKTLPIRTQDPIRPATLADQTGPKASLTSTPAQIRSAPSILGTRVGPRPLPTQALPVRPTPPTAPNQTGPQAWVTRTQDSIRPTLLTLPNQAASKPLSASTQDLIRPTIQSVSDQSEPISAPAQNTLSPAVSAAADQILVNPASTATQEPIHLAIHSMADQARLKPLPTLTQAGPKISSLADSKPKQAPPQQSSTGQDTTSSKKLPTAVNAATKTAQSEERHAQEPAPPPVEGPPKTDFASPRAAAANEFTSAAKTQVQASAPSLAARMDRAIEPPAAPAASTNDIRVRVPDNAGGSTEVRFQESAGEVRVSVRTANQDLAQTLRGGLDDLTHKLSNEGIRTEMWHPGVTPSASPSDSSQASQQSFHQASQQSQQQSPQQDQSGAGKQGSGNQGSAHQGSEGRGQSGSQQRKPQWLEELEASFSDRKN